MAVTVPTEIYNTAVSVVTHLDGQQELIIRLSGLILLWINKEVYLYVYLSHYATWPCAAVFRTFRPTVCFALYL